MDFSEIFDSVKEKAENIKDSLTEKLGDLMETNRTVFFALLGMIFAVLVCILLLVCIAFSSSKKKAKESPVPENVVMGVETPLIPSGPKLPKDYNISRHAEEKWSEEEALEWFTVPGKKEVESLSFSNDKTVKDILEAAP